MSSYTDELDVSPFNDKMTLWILKTPFTYVIGDLDGNEKVVVPKGFVTDFATTKWFKWLLPAMGTYGKACVVHDYLCDFKTITLKNGSTRTCTRKEGDYIFLEAMGVSNVNPIIKYVLFGVVRAYAILTNK
jgi:hypothetical protein